MSYAAGRCPVIVLLVLMIQATASGQVQYSLGDLRPAVQSSPTAETALVAQAANDTQAETLVICPPAYRTALQPWIAYRRQQGHRVRVEPPAGSAYQIRKKIRQIAAEGALKNVVIVGDSGDLVNARAQKVPTDFVRAEVNVLFGSDPEIATDNPYADIDDDGIPDLAVGRLPVDSAAALSRHIERVIAYESAAGNSEWQRRINLIAGVGGFGAWIDKLIEQTTKQMITELIPPAFQTSMTYGSWTSPYCPDPRRFSQTAIERFNEGCLFWVYIGHGDRHTLDKIYLPDQAHRIMDCQRCDQIHAREGSPIAIFLACYTGAMDHEKDCLAETMWSRPQGPIAVVAGSRVTMPYAMSLLSLEMLKEYFDGESATLGQLMLVAKQRMANDSPDSTDPYRQLIEGMGAMFSPQPKLLQAERKEHMHLMHLIGDPLLRIKRPHEMPISAPAQVKAGTILPVTGAIENGRRLTVEIAYRRDRYRRRPPTRHEYDSSDQAFDAYQSAYDDARQLVCLRAQADVEPGRFVIEVPLPETISGDCVVSVFDAERPQLLLGSANIRVQASRPGTRTAARDQR